MPILTPFRELFAYHTLIQTLVSPIIYPVTQVSERFRSSLSFNPLTPFVVADQNVLLYNRSPAWEAFREMIGMGAFMLLFGVLVFDRFRWSLAEEV